jgi:hypothetical protein
MNRTAKAISARAHVGEADVKAAAAAGRSHDKLREAMGVPLMPVGKAAGG